MKGDKHPPHVPLNSFQKHRRIPCSNCSNVKTIPFPFLWWSVIIIAAAGASPKRASKETDIIHHREKKFKFLPTMHLNFLTTMQQFFTTISCTLIAFIYQTLVHEVGWGCLNPLCDELLFYIMLLSILTTFKAASGNCLYLFFIV